DGVTEHQCGRAAAADITGLTCSCTHGQGDLRRTATSVDSDVFVGVDGEIEVLACDISAICRYAHAGDGRCDGIYQHTGSRSYGIESGVKVVAATILQSATIRINGGRYCNSVGIAIARLDGVTEHQRGRAAAAQITGLAGSRANGQCDTRCAATGVDGNVLACVDGKIEILACNISAVGRYADTADGRSDNCRELTAVGSS